MCSHVIWNEHSIHSTVHLFQTTVHLRLGCVLEQTTRFIPCEQLDVIFALATIFEWNLEENKYSVYVLRITNSIPHVKWFDKQHQVHVLIVPSLAFTGCYFHSFLSFQIPNYFATKIDTWLNMRRLSPMRCCRNEKITDSANVRLHEADGWKMPASVRLVYLIANSCESYAFLVGLLSKTAKFSKSITLKLKYISCRKLGLQ